MQLPCRPAISSSLRSAGRPCASTSGKRSSPHGRDALPRDPAWHVHKREQTPYPLYTRERPWESRKRASRRATPDRAGVRPGVRPYHDTNESILTRNKSLPVSPLLELFLDRSVRRITVIFGTSHVSEPQSEPMRARPPATCIGISRVKVQQGRSRSSSMIALGVGLMLPIAC